jgi:hypothetical protein
MKAARALLLVILLAVFTWGVLRLLGDEFSTGGFYPEYSSLRADPLGTKLLFDSLSRLPELHLERNYVPLDYFNRSGTTLLLLGVTPAQLAPEFLKRPEEIARRGNSVLIALNDPKPDADKDRKSIDIWQIALAIDTDPKQPHRLSFCAAGQPVDSGRSGKCLPPPQWNIREQDGDKVLAVDRSFGNGRVLLFAESRDFSNESLISGGVVPVTSAIGPGRQMVFDEQHFGITQSGSVVALARRFHLTGLILGLAIVAALALWKNVSPFPVAGQRVLPRDYAGRNSFEGLVTLLARHVRPPQLLQVAWDEWLKANRHRTPPDRIEQAAAAVRAGASRPLDAIREIQPSLRAKGEL